MKFETVLLVILSVLCVVVTAVALTMSWYSMMDLATATYGLPHWLAVMLSVAFDGGAVFLMLISIAAVLNRESAFTAKLFTYFFIAASMYINLSHGVVNGYGDAGLVMFGAAPVILAIVFEVFTRYLLKDKLREANMLNSRLPNAGLLAWVVEPQASARLFRMGIRNRIMTAAGHLPDNTLTSLMDTLDSVKTTPDSITATQTAPDSITATSDSIETASPTQADFARQLLATDPAINTAEATARWAALGNNKTTYKSFQTALGRQRKRVATT